MGAGAARLVAQLTGCDRKQDGSLIQLALIINVRHRPQDNGARLLRGPNEARQTVTTTATH